MLDPTITCPSCQAEIKLTEQLAAPLLESTRLEFDRRIAEKDATIAKREAAMKAEQEALHKARESLEEHVAERIKEERKAIAAEEAKKAKTLLGGELEQRGKELAEIQEILKERDKKLAEAQKAQAEVLKKQRELEDAQREMELTIEKRIAEGLAVTREKAKKEAEDELKLTVAEREQTISAMKKQIEELKRKAEQGSQQLQGEIQELAIENALREQFPRDLIEPVPKGEFGGDTLQRVFSDSHQPCGTILWESKRTKTWSDAWLVKLRADQRTAKADFAVIVSQAMPKDVETFDQIDGVWVTSQRLLIPIAIVLRHALVELACARQAGEGQQSKMELVYQYLTGQSFRHRVEAIIEKIDDMQQDLEKERRHATKLWSKREQQIRCFTDSIAGMYGDLQGIAGRTMLEIEGLEHPKLTSELPESCET